MSKALVFTEKELVAKDFARALGCVSKGRYFEGDKYVITWLYGHLFRAYEPQEYDESLKTWKLQTLPIIPQVYKNKLIDKPYIKNQFKVIKELANRDDITELINGGDCGVEGEGIVLEVVQALRTKKPLKRIWYDDCTDNSIINAFKNAKDSKEYIKYYYAFLLRSRLDYLVGMNYTRAYTIQLGGGQQVISIGRVQTPLLNLIVNRDNEIKNFIAKPFYKVIANFGNYTGDYINFETKESKLSSKSEAESISKSIFRQNGCVKNIKKEQKQIQSPQLFTLTDLKISLNIKYKFEEEETEKILQELYQVKKIMSYPRTSSNYLTEAIADDFDELVSLLNFGKFSKIVDNINLDLINKTKKNKRYVDNSKVTDHYALSPTMNESMEHIYNDLTDNEKIVFDEVVLRFLAIFYPPYTYESTEIHTEVKGYDFITKGKKEVSKGWKEIYVDGEEKEEAESSIEANINKGDTVNIIESKVVEGKTKKPSHYTTASILSTMKRLGLGTEATRKEITNTLFKRGYIVKDSSKIKATELGHTLIDFIDIESIKSTETTANLEKTLESILTTNVDYNKVYNEFVEELKENVDKVKNGKSIKFERKIEVLGKCPKCESDIVEKKTFYGCQGWKKGCKFTISKTIKNGNVKATDIVRLLEKGSTNQIKGDYKFKLILNEKNDIKLQIIK